jgi:hypothetical protein
MAKPEGAKMKYTQKVERDVAGEDGLLFLHLMQTNPSYIRRLAEKKELIKKITITYVLEPPYITEPAWCIRIVYVDDSEHTLWIMLESVDVYLAIYDTFQEFPGFEELPDDESTWNWVGNRVEK